MRVRARGKREQSYGTDEKAEKIALEMSPRQMKGWLRLTEQERSLTGISMASLMRPGP